jgi:beta-N-acetylhexosaminidase
VGGSRLKHLVRRVGQRFMVGFQGPEASRDVKHLIREYGVGSVILFARNVEAPEQVAELVRELQETAKDAGHDLPLLITVDQEGGRVARMKEPWTLWPPLRVLGQSGSEEQARAMGAALAEELLACGIRCDFAPVMDVDTNPKNPVINDRSFGSDPEQVGRLGVAMIRGLQEKGVAACAKHFPGHGDTDQDTHVELPAVDHSLSRLREVEFVPFRRAIEAGVASIMTCHVLVRELDDKRPATLSPAIVDALLRRELKYGGVVFTDDMDMQAVAKHWPAGEASVLAAKAGCDVLSMCAHHDAQVAAIEGVIRAVESEEISTAALDDSCDRVKRLKQRFALPYAPPDPKRARAAAGTAWALSREISERAGVGA